MFLKKKHCRTNENECNLTLRWKSHCKGKKYFHGRRKATEQAGEKRIKKMVTGSETYTTFTASNLCRADFSDFRKASFWTNRKKDGICSWEVAHPALHLWAIFVSGLLTVQAAYGPLFGQLSWAGFVRCCPRLSWFPRCTNRHAGRPESDSVRIHGRQPPFSLDWPPDLIVVPH